MVVDILKRVFSRGFHAGGDPGSALEAHASAWGVPGEQGVGGAGEGPDIYEVKSFLYQLSDRIGALKRQLLDEIVHLKSGLEEALRNGNRATAEILAAEFALKRKVLHTVLIIEKITEFALRRVSTARQIEEVAGIVTSLMPALSQLSARVAQTSPELSVSLVSMIDSAERLYRSTTSAGKMMGSIDFSLSSIDPELQKIMRMSVEEANREMHEIIPDTPPLIDIEELEQKLLEYIKANGGVVKLREAAKALGVTPAMVKEALYRLARKGVITLSKTSNREGQSVPA